MFNYIGLKLFYYAIIAVIVVGIVFTVKSLFIPLLISLFIAMMLRPLVTFFESKGLSQTTIIVSIYLVFFFALIIALVIVIPLIAQQLAEFSEKMPHYITVLKEQIVTLQSSLDANFTFIDLGNVTQNIKESFGEKISGLSGILASSISNALSLLTYSMLVPFFSFFILKDMHLMNKTLLSYVPNRYFEVFVLLFYKIGNSVQLYIRGQLIDASFVGIMTALGLSIIGFPFALLVGLIAGIGNFVPYFGPILGAIPAILIILVTPEWATGMGIVSVVSVFLTVQMVETIFVYPVAVGNSVNMHPLIIILALLVGGEIAGIVGMIVVIPLVAMIKVTFELLHQYMSAYKIIGY